MHLPHRMILIDGTDHFCSLRPRRAGEDEEVVELCLVHSGTHRCGDGGADGHGFEIVDGAGEALER